MRLFNKVAIIGVGLIGGSIALGLKKKKLSYEVIGISRHKNTLLLAKKRDLIDRGSQQIGIIKDADLVILATPVSLILKLAPIIRKILKPECIVSDVGSTKKEIVSKLEKLFPNYVGCHPLAGSEKRGIINARSDIFKNSLCILTPTENTTRLAKDKIKRLWSQLGAKVAYLSVDMHDKILSFVSHLPHLVAFSLVDTVPLKYLKFSSGGLKDSTRIAASDAGLWADIFLSNRKNMLKTIELFQKNLSKMKSAVNKKDKRLLIKILEEAKKKRERLSLVTSNS
jgi:prephenate dehydrogenase